MGNTGKKRIFQVARELNISHDALISHLKKLNFNISSRMSIITEEMYDEAIKRFGKEIELADKDFDFKRKLKEKRAREEAKKIEAQRDYEEKVRTTIMIMSETPRVRKAKAKTVTAEIESSKRIKDEDQITQAPVKDTSKKITQVKESPDIPVPELRETTTDNETEILKEAETAVKELVEKQKPEKKIKKTEIDDEKDKKDKVESAEPEIKEVEQEPKKTRKTRKKVTAKKSEKAQVAEPLETGEKAEKQVEAAAEAEAVAAKKTVKPTITPPELEKEVVAEAKEQDEEIKAPPLVKVEKKPKDEKELERELELKVIRKIEADKEKKEDLLDLDEQKRKKKPKRKKLKAKERQVETAEAAVAEEEIEDKPKKKRKKKKKQERLEQAPAELEGKKTKFRKKVKKRKKVEIDEEEVNKSIRETFTLMDEGTKAKKRKKKTKADDEELVEENNVLRVHEFISVGELAQEMEIEPNAVIKKCIELGTLVSINQRLDEDTIITVADEFEFEVEIIPELGSEKFEEIEDKDDEQYAITRPPVVTIMGHVDHGKTSLLDYIRESNIIDKESGGITQHIGAYRVNVRDKIITFLDTPGHEAFAAMRARGAQATDIVILVVAADDNVMPQTLEAISHAKAANVPIIVAINKIDKPNANPEAIKKQLADHDVLIESWGGKYQAVEISAKTGQHVDKLLDSILIESEMLELTANPNRLARGVVIESKLDRGKGVVATVLVQKGTLRVGDPFIAGQFSGKVRSLANDRGVKVDSASPSIPVQVMGFSGLPQAGDTFVTLETEKDSKEISYKRQQIKREQDFRRMKHLTLDEISRRIKEGQVKELSIIIKGDVNGSVEAISDSLGKLSNEEVAVRIIHKGVGAISEYDVLLASTSNAIILGFQVRPTIKARETATRENVDIRLYRVIYDAISDVKDALEGLLEPEFEEKNLSVTEIREVFRVPKIGQVAGCYIQSGKVTRNDRAKLYRDDKLVFEGRISTLKRFKDDAKEVMSGFECGITFAGYDDYKIGDIIETFKLTEIKRTLSSLAK